MTLRAAEAASPPSGTEQELTRRTADWVLEPTTGTVSSRVREFWRYRRLLRFFGRKALQKIYARTHLGWVWLFIRPLFPLLVNTLVFGGLLAVGSEGVPYFLFLVAGSAIWELFAGTLTWGTRSLELNRGLIRQIYLPRFILPVAMMTPALLSFLIYIGVLVCALGWYALRDQQIYLNASRDFLWAPAAIVLAVCFALGLALWTSVPAMAARDVRFTLGYVLGFWIFLTPVLYPLSAVPEKWRGWAALNPMAAIVEAFKFGVLGIGAIYPLHLAVATLLIVATLTGGLIFFVRAEADAADKV